MLLPLTYAGIHRNLHDFEKYPLEKPPFYNSVMVLTKADNIGKKQNKGEECEPKKVAVYEIFDLWAITGLQNVCTILFT